MAAEELLGTRLSKHPRWTHSDRRDPHVEPVDEELQVGLSAVISTDGASPAALAATMASTVRSRFLRRTLSARARSTPARMDTLWGRSTLGILPRTCQIAASVGAPVATSARTTVGMSTR